MINAHSLVITQHALAAALLGTIQPRSSALVDLLREAARRTESDASVLWRRVPESKADELFIVAFIRKRHGKPHIGRGVGYRLAIKMLERQTI